MSARRGGIIKSGAPKPRRRLHMFHISNSETSGAGPGSSLLSAPDSLTTVCHWLFVRSQRREGPVYVAPCRPLLRGDALLKNQSSVSRVEKEDGEEAEDRAVRVQERR